MTSVSLGGATFVVLEERGDFFGHVAACHERNASLAVLRTLAVVEVQTVKISLMIAIPWSVPVNSYNLVAV